MRNLKQTYKNIKDNNNKTGRGRKTWEFFDVLEEMCGKDAAIVVMDRLDQTGILVENVPVMYGNTFIVMNRNGDASA